MPWGARWWMKCCNRAKLALPLGGTPNCQRTSSSLRNQSESLKGGLARSCLSLRDLRFALPRVAVSVSFSEGAIQFMALGRNAFQKVSSVNTNEVLPVFGERHPASPRPFSTPPKTAENCFPRMLRLPLVLHTLKTPIIDRKLLFSRTARRVSFFAQRRDFQHGASLFSQVWIPWEHYLKIHPKTARLAF